MHLAARLTLMSKVAYVSCVNCSYGHQWGSQGAWEHVPSVVAGNFFKVLWDSEQYTICDDLWLCSVEYSACVSGFWGLRTQTPPGLCLWIPLGDFRPQTPSFVPLCKFLATPLVVMSYMFHLITCKLNKKTMLIYAAIRCRE